MTKENAKKKIQIGDVMPDGTIYAGISPTTKKPMYAAPADAPLFMTFEKAAKYAKDLKVGGKKDFRVPSKAELNVLFQNRKKGALKGTFNLTGTAISDGGYYWSSTPDVGHYAWHQRFFYGAQLNRRVHKFNYLSVRCVR